MKVSLISTVKDAADHIEEFLGSIAAQTRAPDEVIIVDGGSTDGTLDLLRSFDGITLIEEPGANIARGRNVAIAAAAHDVIAVSDADCVLDPTWLERLLAPIEAGADVSMGFYEPITDGFLQECMAAVNLPEDAAEVDPHDVHAERALGRVRTRRDRGRRDVPGVARHRRGHVGEPSLAASWVSTCGSSPTRSCAGGSGRRCGATWTQYFRYARGDAQAGMHPERHALRFGAYAGLAVAVASRRRWPKLLAAAGAVAYARAAVSVVPGGACPTRANGRSRSSPSPR